MIKAVNPYLNFPGNAEEAFAFYASVFDTEMVGVVRYRDFGDDGMDLAEEDRDRIANIALPLNNGTMLMGTDVIGARGDGFVVGTNTFIHLECDEGAEADRLFEALAEGGKVEMPLTRTAWAEKYGICRDPFGAQWMISYTGEVVFEGGTGG